MAFICIGIALTNKVHIIVCALVKCFMLSLYITLATTLSVMKGKIDWLGISMRVSSSDLLNAFDNYFDMWRMTAEGGALKCCVMAAVG